MNDERIERIAKSIQAGTRSGMKLVADISFDGNQGQYMLFLQGHFNPPYSRKPEDVISHLNENISKFDGLVGNLIGAMKNKGLGNIPNEYTRSLNLHEYNDPDSMSIWAEVPIPIEYTGYYQNNSDQVAGIIKECLSRHGITIKSGTGYMKEQLPSAFRSMDENDA